MAGGGAMEIRLEAGKGVGDGLGTTRGRLTSVDCEAAESAQRLIKQKAGRIFFIVFSKLLITLA